jgi:hypothetical protein
MLENPFLKKKEEFVKKEVNDMNKKIVIGTSVLVILLISSIAFAQGFNQDNQLKGPKVAPEIHEQIIEAMETGDYAAWLEAHEINGISVRPQIADLITEENFDRFVEMHTAKKDGDRELAKEIADELGLEKPMFKRGQKRGMRQGSRDGSGKDFRGVQGGQRNHENCQVQ